MSREPDHNLRVVPYNGDSKDVLIGCEGSSFVVNDDQALWIAEQLADHLGLKLVPAFYQKREGR